MASKASSDRNAKRAKSAGGRSVGSKNGVPTAADLKTRLRDAGLRSTAPRLAVLDYLHRAGAPASHGELHERLSASGFDRATLYRNLMDLAEAGLVTRTDLGDHVWRFELKGSGGASHASDHPHFVCTDCGGVACLPGVGVRITPAKGAPKALGRKDLRIQLSGRCDSCS